MMLTLYETNQLIIEHEFEATWLKEKSTGRILLEDDFYGDPTCGLIDENNRWAIVAGEHLTIWTPNKAKTIDQENLKWVHTLRLKDNQTVEILTDPWSDQPAIWEINVKTLAVKKVRDFDDYIEKEFTENVVW